MKVLVLGAGVVGTTTAYYLHREGHEVEVIEQHDGAALETSFGNAGGLCPSFAGPWAAPGMPTKVLKMSLQANPPVRFSLWPDARRLQWARQWLAQCNAERFRVNKLRMQRVAHYSLACLRELAGEVPIQFDFNPGGVLQLFQTEAEQELGRISAKALKELGIPHQALEAEQALNIEPALAHSRVKLTGALHLPADASGDSHAFSQELARWLEREGVRFHFSTTIQQLLREGDRIVGAQSSRGAHRADATVVALGNHAPAMLAPLGIKLPVYPLKGYSITAQVTDPRFAPNMSVMDEHNKIMISRLGDRVRVAGMAELVGDDLRQLPARKAQLIRLVREMFPDGIDYDHASFWAGLRPMTPDGPAILGPSGIKGLFLNAGHGSNGWTQACGTARVVSDLVSGKRPAIDMDGLTLERFQRA